MERFINLSGLSTANYSALLISFAAQTVLNDVELDAGGITYNSTAVAARDTLVNTKNWDITDSGLD